MLQARVKQDARWRSVTSCAGREFIKEEYRIVPAGFEEEAKNNPFLETRVPRKAAAKKKPAAKEEPAAEEVEVKEDK